MLSDNILAFLIGLAPSLVALIAIYIEGRRNRVALQAELLLRLTEQMDSVEMKSLRKVVSKNLLRNRKPNYELSELLDFFSMICYLYQAKAVKSDLLYHQFGWWIIRYWQCSKEWIQNARRVDPDGWMTIEMVAQEFMEMEKKDGHPAPSDEMLAFFLDIESKLYVPRL